MEVAQISVFLENRSGGLAEVVDVLARHEIESVIGIRAQVTLVEPRTLTRSEGKAKRVTDKRQI